MKRLQAGLVLVIALVWMAPAQAQFFFRKPRPNPSQRVPELILILKTETEERKRAQAAEELREYDAATFTEMVPVLIDVLQNDKKMSVRMEALNSLARFRPVQPTTFSAIEKAANDDESWRVRWQAKTSLAKLQLAGLSFKKAPGDKQTTDEPPLLEPEPQGPPVSLEGLPRMPPLPPMPPPLPNGNVPPGPFAPTPPAKTPSQGPSLFP